MAESLTIGKERVVGTHQKLAIRQVSAAIASSSARQTSRAGVSSGPAAGALLAAATAASGLRICNTIRTGHDPEMRAAAFQGDHAQTAKPQTTKAPDLRGLRCRLTLTY